MPRTISDASLAKIAAHRGVAPINILKILWNPEGFLHFYADRTVPQWQGSFDNRVGQPINVPGKILELGNIENVINLEKNQTSTSLSVKLDDVDGTLKAIINSTDIHRKQVWLLQGFEDLPFSDSFEIYFGEISSPIEWDEGNRTLSFNVVSILEDRSFNKVGFQVDDIAFLNVNVKLIGKAWPLVFGTAFKVPALNITPPPQLITRTGIGLSDPNLSIKIAQLYQKQLDTLQVARNNANYARMAAEGAGAYHFEAEWLSQLFADSTSSDITDFGKITAQGDKLSNEDIKTLNAFNGFANNLRNGTIDPVSGQETFANDAANAMEAQAKQLESVANSFAKKANDYFAQAAQIGTDMAALQLTWAQQMTYEKGSILINTDTFIPQLKNAIIEISGAYFEGSFNADSFAITASYHPRIIQPLTPNNPQIIVKDAADIYNNPQTFTSELYNQPISTISLNTAPISDPTTNIPGSTVTSQFQQFPDFRHQPIQKLGFVYIQPGSQIKILSSNPVTYAVNIIASSVGAVYAERTLLGTGLQYLSIVPPDYYTVGSLSIGGYNATIITFDTPLSSRDLEGWSDSIYVDVISSIGPNTIDIMTWIIDTYTSLIIDSSSFDTVRSILDPAPSNFALLNRNTALKVLNDIAFQAKCILWIVDNVIYIRYLGILPAYIDTITEDDIDVTSLKVKFDNTEDMYTRLVASWRVDYYHKEPFLIGVENNVAQYGIREKQIDYYIYTDPNIIYNSLSYWCVRYSNPWKHLIIKTSLNKLNLDALDPVNLSFVHDYIANVGVQVTGIIEKCNYDSSTYTIDMDVWCPVRLGEMTVYPFAFPDTFAEFQLWPVNEDIRQNLIPDGGLPPIVLIKPTVSSYYFTNSEQYNEQYFTTDTKVRVAALQITYKPDPTVQKPTDTTPVNKYNFNQYPPIPLADNNPADPNTLPNELVTRAPSTPYPAKVLSFIAVDSDINTQQYYFCDIYLNGLSNPPETHFVKQLNIDPNARIDPGTYVTCSKNVHSESDVTKDNTLEAYLHISIEWTMQVPVWGGSGVPL